MEAKDEFSVLLRAGVVGSLAMCAVTTPLDVARRSMQAAVAARKAPPTLREALSEARGRGAAQGLYRGILPSLGQAAVAPSIWLVAYQWQRSKREAVDAAVAARVVQTVTMQPLEFVRTCQQSGLLLSAGAGAHMERSVSQVIWSDGLVSFWRALPVTLARDALAAGTFWHCYVALQGAVGRDDFEGVSHLQAGGLASASAVAAALATQPLDVAKTRMQSHQMIRSGEDGYRKVNYARFFATMHGLWKAAGLRGLWAGAAPRAARAALGGLLLGPLCQFCHVVAEDAERPVRRPLYLPPDPSNTIVHPRSQRAMYIDVK